VWCEWKCLDQGLKAGPGGDRGYELNNGCCFEVKVNMLVVN